VTIHHLALLAGLFVVPAWLTWYGHRLRGRTRSGRAAFWGAVAGHSLATIALAIIVLAPPTSWEGSGGREVAVYWLLLAGAAAGGLAGLLWKPKAQRE
jgi:hypothetical protein